MTMAHPPSAPSTAMAPWEGDTGLEDFKPEDASMPRMLIDHDNACFKDSQTEETYDELECIMLGLVKTRIMWGPLEDEKSAPLCKSPDTKLGFPLVDPEVPKSKHFPWKAQEVFTEDDLRRSRTEEGVTQPHLPCDKCHFKEWGTDPSANRPWCSEEWIFPILYKDKEGQWTPALFAAKRSAMKPSKNYVTPFSASRRPMFGVHTRISLEELKRGKVEYCIPRYEKMGPSDASMFDEYYAGYLSARQMLSRMPIERAEGDVVEDTINSDIIDVTYTEETVKTPPPEPAQTATPTPEASIPTPKPEVQEPVADPRQPEPVAPPVQEAPPASAGTATFDPNEEPPF